MSSIALAKREKVSCTASAVTPVYERGDSRQRQYARVVAVNRTSWRGSFLGRRADFLADASSYPPRRARCSHCRWCEDKSDGWPCQSRSSRYFADGVGVRERESCRDATWRRAAGADRWGEPVELLLSRRRSRTPRKKRCDTVGAHLASYDSNTAPAITASPSSA